MTRYFEQVGKRVTVKLTLTPPASTASAEELSDALKTELRELTRPEYAELTKKYGNQ